MPRAVAAQKPTSPKLITILVMMLAFASVGLYKVFVSQAASSDVAVYAFSDYSDIIPGLSAKYSIVNSQVGPNKVKVVRLAAGGGLNFNFVAQPSAKTCYLLQTTQSQPAKIEITDLDHQVWNVKTVTIPAVPKDQKSQDYWSYQCVSGNTVRQKTMPDFAINNLSRQSVDVYQVQYLTKVDN